MPLYQEKENSGFRLLKEALKEKNPGRLYVFFGEEDYLRNYYLDALKKLLMDGPAADFNFHRFNAESMNINTFGDALDALPMMTDRSLIRIDDYDPFKDSEDNRNRLAAMLSDLPDYCCVVFNYISIPWKPDKRMKKLWDAFRENAISVEFAKQTERELCAWIFRHFKSYGKEIDNRLASYLVFVTGASMTAIAAEIEKIAAYSDADIIKRFDIDQVVEPVLDAVVFDITDALTKGNFALALEKLQGVLKKQEDPFAILGAVSTQMRRLRAAKVLQSEGRGKADLCRLCGIREYPAAILMNAAAGLSEQFCDRAVLLCEETDFRIKNSYDTPERMLELLLLKIAEEAHHA